jgi:hypothetical protein
MGMNCGKEEERSCETFPDRHQRLMSSGSEARSLVMAPAPNSSLRTYGKEITAINNGHKRRGNLKRCCLALEESTQMATCGTAG